MYKKKIHQEEFDLVDDFLERFVYVSDGNSHKETIDLKMTLKALPIKIDEDNVERISLINFTLM